MNKILAILLAISLLVIGVVVGGSSSLISDKKELADAKNEIAVQYEELQRTNSTLQNANDDLTNENTSLKDTNSILQESVDTLTTENTSLREQNQNISTNINNMNVSFNGYSDSYNLSYINEYGQAQLSLDYASSFDANFVSQFIDREVVVTNIVRFALYEVAQEDGQTVNIQFFDSNLINETLPCGIEVIVDGELTTDLSNIIGNGEYIGSLEFETKTDDNGQICSVNIRFMFDLTMLTLENGGIETVTMTNAVDGSVLDELFNVRFEPQNSFIYYSALEPVDYDRVITLTTFKGEVYTGTIQAGSSGDGMLLTLEI